MTQWQLYSPTSSKPWNLRRVAHLQRRTVFAGTWIEVQRDLADSPENAVGRILNGEVRAEGVPDDFEAMADLIGKSAAESSNADRLKAWWIYRCLFSPDPLRERLTLMWHNHFATSNLKVSSLPLMKRQSESLREHSRSPFGDLLHSMLRDPALLLWLDADANRKGHPNENLARELMELFTLGIGNFTEDDVKNAARALTGITVRDGEFRFENRRHDDGQKTILGTTDGFDTDALADMLLKQPATAKRLAWRLTNEFFGDGVVDDRALDELTQQLTVSGLNIAQAVETMLRSKLFFSDANIASRVCDPLSFLIAPLRAFELFNAPPSTMLLADWLQRMGLDLFYPPNVGGWEGGRTWLNTRTVIARTNYVSAVVNGELNRPVETPALAALAEEHGLDLAKFVEQVLFGEIPEGFAAGSKESVVRLLTQPETHLH